MRVNRLSRVLAAAAATALTATGLAVVTAPAGAATKSTVTVLSTGQITSLNSGTSTGNTTYNSQAGYLTGAGFTYYDSDTKLVRNTAFGTMSLIKNTKTSFQIKYTVRKGQVWSDGTPIDAVDLLLSHVVQSDKYSIAAGLGDPSKVTPKFDSISYGGAYNDHLVGLPALSADKYSLTLTFDQPMPDWELYAPGPSPVHALELMADGKSGLQPLATNLKAKAQFLSDFTKKNTSRLTKMGKIWSEDYNLAAVTASTNKLLLISNGGFILSKGSDAEGSWTFVRNTKYTSGPKMATTNPIKTVVIKIIKDNTAAVQALRNGDIDIYYNTLPTSADKTTLAGLAPKVTTVTKVAGNYSHLGLRTAAYQGSGERYTGPFAGNGTKAKDLRHAFLLAVPREQMLDTLIRPVSSTAKVMDTHFAFTGTSEYNTIVKGSGDLEYTAGTQAQRTAKAKALVKKWYPDCETNPVVVKFVHANTPLRNALAALIKAEADKACFEVKDTASADLFGSGDNQSSKYDASMYGFGLTSVSQANATEIFKSDGGNNVWGWSNAALDDILTSLAGDALTAAQVTAKRAAAQKIIHDNYWGQPLYQNPTIAAYTTALKNVKPAPIGQNVVWNYWEWHY